MSEADRFAPKTAVKLDPPKDDIFTVEELAKYDGVKSPKIYVAIKGTIFDVTRNHASYGPGQGYHIFVAKDASRALARSSLEEEDAVPQYDDLPENQLKTLDEWYRFFSLRYNIVGRLADAKA